MQARSSHRALGIRGGGSFTSWVARVCLAVAICSSTQASVLPDAASARAFGFALQQDFQARRSQAIIERLDSPALMSRVFGPFGPDAVADPQAKDMWDTVSFPGLVRELGAYDEGFRLLMSRVMLVDGSRFLECILLDQQNALRMLSLRLNQSVDGQIRIEDLHFSGSELEVSRTLRQILILVGYRTERLLDPEEEALSSLAAKHPMRAGDIFSSMREQKYNQAFGFLSLNYRDLNHTRIWRELRNRLANLGCAPAQRHLAAECADGKITNSFLRFAVISTQGDKALTLAALEQVLVKYRDPSFLRAMKAALLVEVGRASEALMLAQDIYELNPQSGSAYYAAVLAAVQTTQTAAAFTALDGWAMVVAREEIDRILQGEPTMVEFCASARYVAWKQAASNVLPPATAQPVTAARRS